MDLERYRDYLHVLAHGQLADNLRSRVDTSDVVQESLWEAHRDETKFRGSTEAELRAWLRQILVHNLANQRRTHRAKIRDVRREQAVRAAVEETSTCLDAWAADVSQAPDKRALRDEQLLQLANALEQLPDVQREVVMLKHLQGLTIDETAKRLDLTPGSAAGHLYRGLTALRKILSDEASSERAD